MFNRIILTCALLFVAVDSVAWGQTGHRVTGEIAELYLTDEAKAAVEALIGNEDLAEASTWPDEMRSNPSEFWQKTASPWHYVNVKIGEQYGTPPSRGDAVTALNLFSRTLKDPNASLENKQLALRFIVHIIGDLHQPFHSGTSEDRGGNLIRVKFFNEDSNIHRVWDTNLIDNQKLSYTEWTKRLSRQITPDQAKTWQETDPRVWISESVENRTLLYPKSSVVSWDYQYMSMPIVKKRLSMGGVRIAAYLNDLFAS
jgi:hypothetical protein